MKLVEICEVYVFRKNLSYFIILLSQIIQSCNIKKVVKDFKTHSMCTDHSLLYIR